MLLLLYIDTNKQVNREGETMRPNNRAVKCCRLLSKLKNSGEVVVSHTELLACHLYLRTKGSKSPQLKYLNTTY